MNVAYPKMLLFNDINEILLINDISLFQSVYSKLLEKSERQMYFRKSESIGCKKIS